MIDKIDLIYISLSGNTDSFAKRLKESLLLNSNLKEINLVNVKDLIKDNKDFYKVKNRFIALLPTYLEGGNGIDNGYTEILTTPLKDFIKYKNNFENSFINSSSSKGFDKNAFAPASFPIFI